MAINIMSSPPTLSSAGGPAAEPLKTPADCSAEPLKPVAEQFAEPLKTPAKQSAEPPAKQSAEPPEHDDYVVRRLREHLDRAAQDHGREIAAQPSLKRAHIYCVVNAVSSQKYGPLLEKFIIARHRMTRTRASAAAGDCSRGESGGSVEIKASLGGASHAKFNYVQIRPGHCVDEYVFTAFHLTAENCRGEGELYVFKIGKKALMDVVALYGGYAHGTIKKLGPITSESIREPSNTKEYALRPSFGDKCWRALIPFRIPEGSI